MNEVMDCGKSGGRKIRSDYAWKPKLGCREKEIDRKIGLWGPVIYKNGALVSLFH